MLWEFVSKLLSQLEAIGPVETSWSAQDLTDFGHLVLFWLTREKGSHSEKFGHDAPHRKNINWGIVVGSTEQDLRGSIPARAHIVCKRRSRIDFFGKSISINAQIQRCLMSIILDRLIEKEILTQSQLSSLSGGSIANFLAWDLCVGNCVCACMRVPREIGT